ncbi:MAG: metal ABC transporter substrate-binding protein, partial [Oscillospiraceae bacterium]|nr:metal ABC transporter substrate-binding protein [Oscillospiraceae bacterium]
MKKIMAGLLCLGLCLGLFGACGTASTALPEDGKLKVVASIFPEYDFAKAIGGDLAHVAMLIAPGASIHSYDPSPSEMKTVQQADIFLYIGGESDVWADRLLASLDTSNMKIVRLMDAVKLEEEEL